jgi:hypothetical protein
LGEASAYFSSVSLGSRNMHCEFVKTRVPGRPMSHVLATQTLMSLVSIWVSVCRDGSRRLARAWNSYEKDFGARAKTCLRRTQRQWQEAFYFREGVLSGFMMDLESERAVMSEQQRLVMKRSGNAPWVMLPWMARRLSTSLLACAARRCRLIVRINSSEGE